MFWCECYTALGESILAVIGCLVPFLETDVLHCLPYTVATTLAVFPPTLHKDVVELLCANLLPVTLSTDVYVIFDTFITFSLFYLHWYNMLALISFSISYCR